MSCMDTLNLVHRTGTLHLLVSPILLCNTLIHLGVGNISQEKFSTHHLSIAIRVSITLTLSSVLVFNCTIVCLWCMLQLCLYTVQIMLLLMYYIVFAISISFLNIGSSQILRFTILLKYCPPLHTMRVVFCSGKPR